ncbi:MAG: glycosyltransferase family 4 protein [Nitrospirae bacterium]|nr:glycosyltransferase family 4 protein [Nitrospirota bacterium]
MKIAIVTPFPDNPEAPRGGPEVGSVTRARRLAAFGDLDLHVVTFSPAASRPDISSWQGVTIHRLPEPTGSVLFKTIGKGRRKILQYLLELAPEVVHAHDTYGIMVKGVPIPRVLTIHGFIHEDTRVSGRHLPWLRAQLWRWVETAAWADYPHIISISPYVRERLRGISTGVIHDIENPVADSFFHVIRHEKKGTLFSAGVISPRKNTLTLIEAFALLTAGGCSAELRLAGEITDPVYGRHVRDAIRKHGLENRVVLLGRLGTPHIMKELSTAGVFVLVSLEENAPMGIAEAMAAGIPIVTSNRCGMPYMVRHGESGFLVNPKDPVDIAFHLRQLIENSALRNLLGKRSREIASDMYNPERVAKQTRDVYYEAAGVGITACKM